MGSVSSLVCQFLFRRVALIPSSFLSLECRHLLGSALSRLETRSKARQGIEEASSFHLMTLAKEVGSKSSLESAKTGREKWRTVVAMSRKEFDSKFQISEASLEAAS